MPLRVDLSVHEISVPVVVRNAPPARLYEDAVTREHAAIMASGAIAICSGAVLIPKATPRTSGSSAAKAAPNAISAPQSWPARNTASAAAKNNGW